ncbi:hypothetical protein [Marinobacterium aestuariivivens]|uniref:RecBCD enzyme subunit RecD N-terminal domain-containing protein n=1 Tax=Marinobacterium aestuariivivens TaxID=1698799 RepID=A0ABW1ZUX7_9GAMM
MIRCGWASFTASRNGAWSSRWTGCSAAPSCLRRRDNGCAQSLARDGGARGLRPLDVQFARFLHETGGCREPALLVLAALVSFELGRGNVCLPLASVPALIDSLPPEVGDRLRPWLGACGSPVSARIESASKGFARGAAPAIVRPMGWCWGAASPRRRWCSIASASISIATGASNAIWPFF